MNDIYLWTVTAVTGAVALTTLIKLWTDRERLWLDDLHDEDRLFAWRIVLFLVYPIMTFVDLRSTIVACQTAGGYIKEPAYGLFWYSAIPQGIANTDHLLIVLFTGAAVQMLLALSFLPSLIFRPHPFFASVLGYAMVAILGLNLIIDPLLSIVGMGGSRWQLAMMVASPAQKLALFATYGTLALAYMTILAGKRTRVWFAHLTRPLVAEQLSDALLQWKVDPRNPHANARLSILYERAGLRRQAVKHWKKLDNLYPSSIYSSFVEAMLSYRQRKYAVARKQFLYASDCPHVDPPLKGTLLAAAACAAFAQGDMEGALNLSERALEFDDASLVARMVKVDVFLRTGKKEQAGEEIIAAIRRGLDLDLESKVPLDSDFVLHRINRLQSLERTRRTVGTRS